MQQRTSYPDDFAAFVGLDWADAKHDICIQAADADTRESHVLPHKSEAIDEWVTSLHQRFDGKPIAIALELDKGPIVAALQKYDCLVLFAINPLTLARYREAFATSSSASSPRALRCVRCRNWSKTAAQGSTTQCVYSIASPAR